MCPFALRRSIFHWHKVLWAVWAWVWDELVRYLFSWFIGELGNWEWEIWKSMGILLIAGKLRIFWTNCWWNLCCTKFLYILVLDRFNNFIKTCSLYYFKMKFKCKFRSRPINHRIKQLKRVLFDYYPRTLSKSTNLLKYKQLFRWKFLKKLQNNKMNKLKRQTESSLIKITFLFRISAVFIFISQNYLCINFHNISQSFQWILLYLCLALWQNYLSKNLWENFHFRLIKTSW